MEKYDQRQCGALVDERPDRAMFCENLDANSKFTPIKGFVWKIMQSRRKEIEKIFNEEKFEEIPLNKKKMLIDVYEDDIRILSFCQTRFRELFSSSLDL